MAFQYFDYVDLWHISTFWKLLPYEAKMREVVIRFHYHSSTSLCLSERESCPDALEVSTIKSQSARDDLSFRQSHIFAILLCQAAL
jgi:hypothetical protein